MKKIVSLALCLAMVFSILPMGSLKIYADTANPEIIWLEKDYELIEAFSEGMALVKLGGKWGCIDKTGREVISPKYNYAWAFSEGLSAVGLDGKWGCIDKTGREVIALKYNYVGGFSEGLSSIDLNGKWGCIDKTGREVITPKYNYVWAFSEGLASVGLDEKMGFIDRTGREIFFLENDYDYAGEFKDGLAMVAIGDDKLKCGFIDKTGREVIALKYDNVQEFRDGLANVMLNNKYGFIDKTGREVIAPKYNYAGRFREGLIAVGLNEKYGFIDKTGKEVIALKYDFAGDFKEGLASVKLNEKYGFIDKTGKEVIAPKYDAVEKFSEGMAPVKLNGKWGLMKHPLAKASVKPQAPADNSITAKYSSSKLSIDGVAAKGMEIYNIDNNNYFKLRDVAKLLDATDKKFSVGWNNEKKLISLVSGENYVTTGTELSGGDGKDKSAAISTAKMELNGKEVKLKAYTIGGNNYFKLRDLCDVLGVKVDWDQATSTILLKTK